MTQATIDTCSTEIRLRHQDALGHRPPIATRLARRLRSWPDATPIGRQIPVALAASLLCLLFACDARVDSDDADVGLPAAPVVRTAPVADGHLYVLGDDVACLEFTLDPTAGQLIMRVWNADRNKLIPLQTQWVEIQLAPIAYGSATPARGNITLVLAADPSRWKDSNHASEFSAAAPRLRDLKSFVAVLGQLNLLGTDYAGVEIEYPADGIVHTQKGGD